MPASKYHNLAPEWAKRYLSGESTTSISRDSGVPTPTICYQLEKQGVTLRVVGDDTKTARASRLAEFLQEVAQMYFYSDMMVTDLADMYGVTTTTINDWVRSAGYDVVQFCRSGDPRRGPQKGLPVVDFTKVAPHPGERGRAYNLKRYEAVCGLIHQGCTYDEIAELFGVTRQAIGLMVNKLHQWSKEQTKKRVAKQTANQ